MTDIQYFGQWLAQWREPPIDFAGVTDADVRAYRQYLVNTQRQKPATVNRRLQALRRQDRWVYAWVEGIYSGLRAEDAKLCALVVIGVNERGQKQFLAIEDGIRESTQSWREVLLDLRGRGMNAPELAVGDGAMGF